jgi:uncharacterized protein (DUF2235 family)
MGDVAGRNIILLSDGTGNSAGKLFKTNVWRVYDALDLSNASQIASYDDGVGTSWIKPLAVFGGAFGWGLKRNVLALYTFLCRNYRSGDRIYAFGFSRGAFTIRVLIGFVLSQKLVADATSNDDLRRKALRLYRTFRVERTQHYGLYTLGRPLRNFLVRLWDWIFGRSALSKIGIAEVPQIEFLGLWDTVDAYGLPIEELKRGVDRWVWPLSLDDKTIDPRINKACHALSIDDKRTTFHPLLWDENDLDPVDHTDRERLTQVWFSGSHANVGGGYPDDSLSYVPLRWMINEARKRKLNFNDLALKALDVKISPYGRIYDSRAGLGAYYRFDPRRLDPPRDRQGACIPCPKIHETVLWRMAAGTDFYAPLSVPKNLRVVTDGRTEQDTSEDNRQAGANETASGDHRIEKDAAVSSRPVSTTGNGSRMKPNILGFHDYIAAVQAEGDLFGTPAGRGADPEKRRRAATEIAALTMPDDKALELMWDTVWWRRIAYFTTLISTGLLALYPVLFGASTEEANYLIKQVAGLATTVLPSLAQPWLDAFQSDPVGVSVLFAATIVFVGWGKLLDRRIHDRALAAWNSNWREKRYRAFQESVRWRRGMLAILVVAFLGGGAASIYFGLAVTNDLFLILGVILLLVFALLAIPMVIQGLILWLISRRAKVHQSEIRGLGLLVAYGLRRSTWFVGLYRLIAWGILPTAFAAGLVAMVIYGINRLSFEFMDSVGWICTRASDTSPPESKPIDFNFEIDKACQSSNARLSAKVKYLIQITEVKDWRDGNLEVGPQGVSTWQLEPHRWLLLPMRRRFTTRWFVVIARIGETGSEEYALTHGSNTEITPTRNGDLFFYVNEAVIGLPGIENYFYRGKPGSAKITITRAGDELKPKQ